MRLVPDRVLAAITIRQEAAGEPYNGKVAVGAVILRRTREKYNSNGTVAGTILRRAQFSGWWDGSLERDLNLDDAAPDVQDCLRAWDDAVRGVDPTNGAVLYCNERLVRQWHGGTLPRWADPKKVTARIGQHTFYSR